MRLFRPQPRITIAAPADAGALADLYRRAWLSAGPGVPPEVVADQSPPADEVSGWFRGGFEVYRAGFEGELVGVIRCSFPTGASVLDRLAVDPDHRRRGVGRALVEHAISRARRAGVTRVWLHLHPTLEAAVELHHSLGFRESARISPGGHGDEVLLMEMAL